MSVGGLTDLSRLTAPSPNLGEGNRRPRLSATPSNSEGDNFEFWQMRVSERKGCVLASKGSKECKPNIYTKQATPVPSGSILDKTTFCQF